MVLKGFKNAFKALLKPFLKPHLGFSDPQPARTGRVRLETTAQSKSRPPLQSAAARWGFKGWGVSDLIKGFKRALKALLKPFLKPF